MSRKKYWNIKKHSQELNQIIEVLVRLKSGQPCDLADFDSTQLEKICIALCTFNQLLHGVLQDIFDDANNFSQQFSAIAQTHLLPFLTVMRQEISFDHRRAYFIWQNARSEYFNQSIPFLAEEFASGDLRSDHELDELDLYTALTEMGEVCEPSSDYRDYYKKEGSHEQIPTYFITLDIKCLELVIDALLNRYVDKVETGEVAFSLIIDLDSEEKYGPREWVKTTLSLTDKTVIIAYDYFFFSYPSVKQIFDDIFKGKPLRIPPSKIIYSIVLSIN